MILRRQVDRAKGRLVAELKAEGVPYEERMARLEEVTHPKPLADFLYGAFDAFRAAHPWTAGSDVSPKSIGREMFETFAGFSDYVKSYGLERSEGVLLRYLSQLYRTLDQTVPEAAKTDELWDVLGFFRSLVGETDASLLEEWESLRHPELLLAEQAAPAAPAQKKEATWLTELLANPRVFAARVRAEAQLLVRALARKDWEEAAERVYADAGRTPLGRRRASRPRWRRSSTSTASCSSGAEARLHHLTRLRAAGPRRWEVTQTLLDPKGDNTWAIFAEIDLTDARRARRPDPQDPAHRAVKRAILHQVVPVSTPFLLGLAFARWPCDLVFPGPVGPRLQARLGGEQGPQHGRSQRAERRSGHPRPPLTHSGRRFRLQRLVAGE